MGYSERRHFLKLSGAAGITALAGCQDVSGIRENTPTKDETENLGLVVASSGPSCLHELEDGRSGWVHTVADGETYDMTFDIRVSHGRDEEASVGLISTPISGEYVLKLAIGAAEEEKQPISEPDCDVATQLTGGGDIPKHCELLPLARQ